MIYITQLLYIKKGREKTFHQFEDLVIPLLSKHNGRLLLRIRPHETEIIESTIDIPYEIHLLAFSTDHDLDNFMNDEDRKSFLHLKEHSIKSVVIIKGKQV